MALTIGSALAMACQGLNQQEFQQFMVYLVRIGKEVHDQNIIPPSIIHEPPKGKPI